MFSTVFPISSESTKLYAVHRLLNGRVPVPEVFGWRTKFNFSGWRLFHGPTRSLRLQSPLSYSCLHEASDFIISKIWTAVELTAVMKNHILKAVQHLGKRCTAWDVVNEPINDDSTLSSSI
ncbi:hypothetical protein PENNAL_c0032G04908 [Penicillium nalgiovense]|uniref:endo-1,4-beta-xylanase n=1 Tax=Penicillium nalgiovense TaxID=60175 RepID=A0A1V6Y7I8_PENNA|nr:hypothetical protein PENNAL_c0032G04908 [Penicillium nalgiovense]